MARDIIGEKFGRLTVIREVDKVGKDRMYYCECDCGNIYGKTVKRKNLVGGYTKSCGCLRSGIVKTRENPVTFYPNHSKLPNWKKIIAIWSTTIAKCHNPKMNNYKWYGAKGITVCDEWKEGYEARINFYNWAIENGYRNGLELDRIENEKGYSPDNCRWITHIDNCNNMSENTILNLNEIDFSNSKLEIKIENIKSKLKFENEITIPEFISEIENQIRNNTKISKYVFPSRKVIKNRWLEGIRNIDELIKPSLFGFEILEIDGIYKTIDDWCLHYKTTYTSALKRYQRGVKGRDLFSPKQHLGTGIPFDEEFLELNLIRVDGKRGKELYEKLRKELIAERDAKITN